jgi:hypothetical protein
MFLNSGYFTDSSDDEEGKMSYRFLASGVFALSVLTGLRTMAQAPPSPAVLIAAQRDAMRPLAVMDGVWRGNAWTVLRSGEKHTITQTERIGPFLDGSIKVVEGRVNPDGYVWEIPAGPMKIRYTAVIKPDSWREIGEYISPGKDPIQFFEMNLKKVGETVWPSAGAIPMTGTIIP